MSAETPARRKISAREAAAKLGVSTRTIKRLVAEPRDEYEARAKARRDRAVELRAQGLKCREIAEEMGISTGVVGNLLRVARRLDAGLPPYGKTEAEYRQARTAARQARTAARRDQAVALRKQGMKYKEIAKEMDVSTDMVGNLLREARKLEGRNPNRDIG